MFLSHAKLTLLLSMLTIYPCVSLRLNQYLLIKGDVVAMLKRKINSLVDILFGNKPTKSKHKYWEGRARKYGKRAVLNLSHSKSEIKNITNYQIDQIFPHLEIYKSQEVEQILDYGCGPGRFSRELAEFFDAKVLAVDPIKRFLKMAPKHPLVEYKVLDIENINSDTKFDVIWICLVLGGLEDEEVREVQMLLESISKKGTLLCLVENTADKDDAEHWKFRTSKYYQKIFDKYNLKVKNTYLDIEEEISVMIGKSD